MVQCLVQTMCAGATWLYALSSFPSSEELSSFIAVGQGLTVQDTFALCLLIYLPDWGLLCRSQ